MPQLDFAPLTQHTLAFFFLFFVFGILLLNVLVSWLKPNKFIALTLVKLFINPFIVWTS